MRRSLCARLPADRLHTLNNGFMMAPQKNAIADPACGEDEEGKGKMRRCSGLVVVAEFAQVFSGPRDRAALIGMIMYIVSPLLTALVALVPGWGVHYAEGVRSIDIATLARTVMAALGLSGAIFAEWGLAVTRGPEPFHIDLRR